MQAKPELATFRLKKGRANQAYVPKPKVEREKPKKEFKPRDKKPHKRPEREARVMSAGVKEHRPEDSPFAILQQLNTKK